MIQVIKHETEDGITETKTVTFKYDPFGRRIEKRVEEVENNEAEIKTYTYIYDNEDIILETITETEDGVTTTETNKYIHGLGIDEPLSFTNNKGTYYYHVDGLGSIVALTDATGKVVQEYEYDSFGNLHDQKNRIKQPYTYTGREWDREIKLYYYRNRYYDPEIGRFINKDLFLGFLQNPQLLNPYPYTQNNPIIRIDPLGLW